MQRVTSAWLLPRPKGACTSTWYGSIHFRLKRGYVLGCSGDLVNRLSNGPYRASYGLLWGLCGILNGLTKSTDHPSTFA